MVMNCVNVLLTEDIAFNDYSINWTWDNCWAHIYNTPSSKISPTPIYQLNISN